MKKFCFYPLMVSIAIFSMLCVIGCGGDSPEDPTTQTPVVPPPDSSPDSPATPSLSFKSITFPNCGDSFSCNIYGLESGSWSAVSKDSWCCVSVHGNVIKVTVEPNEGAEQRLTKVSILDSDNRELDYVMIVQCSLASDSYTEVSSSSKSSFYPMFTATWCQFCPDMDRTLENIRSGLDNQILAMRIHVSGSGLYTPLSEELSRLYDNTAVPEGYFENCFKVENIADANASLSNFWNLLQSHIYAGNGYPDSRSYLSCKGSVAGNDIKADITIKPAVAGKYRLLAFILEDNIVMPQTYVEERVISDYRHDDVLRGALTPLKGEELVLTDSPKVLSLNGAVPPDVNAANLRLLIVLQRDIPFVNYSDNCWYADNCISVGLPQQTGSGEIENIVVGEEIEN